MRDIRKLLRFVKPYRGLALFAFLMLLAMVALDLAIPRLVETIIDQGIKPKDMGVVLGTSALMLAVSVLDTIVAVLNSNSSVRVGESVARDLREAIFVKIQAFSYGDLDRFSTGKLMVRLTSDASAVQRLTQVSLRIGTRAPLSMIGSIVLMFITSPSLALLKIPLLAVTAAFAENGLDERSPFGIVCPWTDISQTGARWTRCGAGATELVNWPGMEPVKVYGIEVGFEQLADSKEREYFDNLPTRFSLPPGSVDRLREVAGRLLRESKSYQELLRDLPSEEQSETSKQKHSR